jgi:hypothetical protein
MSQSNRASLFFSFLFPDYDLSGLVWYFFSYINETRKKKSFVCYGAQRGTCREALVGATDAKEKVMALQASYLSEFDRSGCSLAN